MTLDDLRAAYPELGFALYAYDPRGPVTLEVHAAEGVFTFTSATAQGAIVAAFPGEEIPDAQEPRAAAEAAVDATPDIFR